MGSIIKRKRIKVYILEDEWMWTEAIIAVINKNNEMEVLGDSASAERGFPKILKLMPDIVLVDIRLKGEENGIQVAKKIMEECQNTKVIIFTSDLSENHLKEMVNTRASGYLLKQEVNDPQILINAIKIAISGEAYITPVIAKRLLSLIQKFSINTNRFCLSEREIEILDLVAKGKKNKEIAKILFISERTVANHLRNIYQKMDAKNRMDAINIAKEENII